MKRHDLINYCLSVPQDQRRETLFIEIGVDNPSNTFNNVMATHKIGVDPYMDDTGCHVWNERNREFLMEGIHGVFVKKTSDQFFDSVSHKLNADVIFIDGLHTEEQVDRDITNSLSIIHQLGIILIDDVLPTRPGHVRMPPLPGSEWMGTVFRSFWKMRNRPFLTGVVKECGVGFVIPSSSNKDAELNSERLPAVDLLSVEESYHMLRRDPDNMFNVIPFDVFKTIFF